MKTSLARIRHARSKQEFPFLPLEEGEYVELALTRSKLGLVLIWGGVAIALLGIILFATIISSSLSASSLGGIPNSAMPYFFMLIISFCVRFYIY